MNPQRASTPRLAGLARPADLRAEVAAQQRQRFRDSYPTRSIAATNRGFASTTEPGCFAQTGPVLGHPVRDGPGPAHADPAGPLRGDLAGAGCLLSHFGRSGPFGAGQVLEHLAKPELVHPAQAAQVRRVPGRLARLTKPEIASIRLQMEPQRFRSGSDRGGQTWLEFRWRLPRPLRLAAKPEPQGVIGLLAMVDLCRAEGSKSSSAKP